MSARATMIFVALFSSLLRQRTWELPDFAFSSLAGQRPRFALVFAIYGEFYTDLVLDCISRTTVDHDISVFFRKSFREIRDDYEDLPADWPGDETQAFLVQRADGLFI